MIGYYNIFVVHLQGFWRIVPMPAKTTEKKIIYCPSWICISTTELRIKRMEEEGWKLTYREAFLINNEVSEALLFEREPKG